MEAKGTEPARRTLVEKAVARLKKPGMFFRFGTVQKRGLYMKLSKVLRPTVMKKRTVAVEHGGTAGLEIDQDLGYRAIDNFAQSPIVLDALEEARSDLRQHDAAAQNQRKIYLQTVAPRRPLDLQHPYMKLALSPEVVSIATKYLGYVPVLSDILLWHSPNVSARLDGSQFFHLDHADVRQVKVFLLVNDIDPQTGPLTLIPAHIGRKICDAIDYRLSTEDIRVPDEVINQHLPEDQHVKAVGSAGTLFFADTSRCFHYGSRSGTKPRTVLLIQYVSPFSFRFSIDFKKDAKFSGLIRPTLPPVQKLLLGDQ